MTTHQDPVDALMSLVCAYGDCTTGRESDALYDRIEASARALGAIPAERAPAPTVSEPAVIVTVSKDGSVTTTDIKWLRTFFEGDTPLYLAAQPPAILAALAVQDSGDLDWIKPSDRLPEDETVVLAMRRGQLTLAEIRWEHPSFEDTYKAFRFWCEPDEKWIDDNGLEEGVEGWLPLRAALASPPAINPPKGE